MSDLYIVPVDRKFAIKIAPNFYWWDLKEAGIEAWLETNVGRYNRDWIIPGGMGDEIGFYNSADATAFKLKFGP